jgi:hypothetical protein
MVMDKKLMDLLAAWGLLESEQDYFNEMGIWSVEDFKCLSEDYVVGRHRLLKYLLQDMKKLPPL